jgi:acetylornithine deacetylase
MTAANDRIIASVDRHFDDQVRFLEDLVRFRSLRNEETEAQGFIESALKQRGFTISRFRTDASQIGRHPAFSPATVDYWNSRNVVGRKTGKETGARSLALTPTSTSSRQEALSDGHIRHSYPSETGTGSTAAVRAT